MARWLIWSGFAVAWTTLLLLPGREFNRVGVDRWPTDTKIYAAKSLHVLAFAFFTCLSGWLGVSARRRWMLLFVLMAHATLTELLQLAFEIPGRNGSLWDVALNQSGVLLGLLVSWKWWNDPA